MLLLDLLYTLLLLVSFPVWLRFLLRKSYRDIIRRRLWPDLSPSDTPRLWIHAVSVGEVHSLKRLLSSLRESTPLPVVLTVTTPSGLDRARSAFPGIEVIPAPLDFSVTVRRFIDRIHPAALVLNELEIWPNWIRAAARRDVPIALINGRISGPAFRRYRPVRRLIRPLMARLDLFLLQSEFYRHRFSVLGAPASRIAICGNIKADEAWGAAADLPAAEAVFTHLKTAAPERPLVILASTHPADEERFIPLIARLQQTFAFIVVPRHPGRAPAVGDRLEAQGIRTALWTRAADVDLHRQVLVYDEIGYLMRMFAVADLVLMGGTFDAAIGGHNLYEPAACGKPVVGGPHNDNFPDIARDLAHAGVYRMGRTVDELEAALKGLVREDAGRLASAARDIVDRNRGSIACTMEHLHPLLNR